MKNIARLLARAAAPAAIFGRPAPHAPRPPSATNARRRADWGTRQDDTEKTGITVPQDNKNSGQTLAQLVAEKASPVPNRVLGVT